MFNETMSTHNFYYPSSYHSRFIYTKQHLELAIVKHRYSNIIYSTFANRRERKKKKKGKIRDGETLCIIAE